MIPEDIIPYAVIALVFLIIETGHFVYRRRQLKHARNIILSAKRESLEMAQLPLNNPHPLIQIDRHGNIIFANPAAVAEFAEHGEVAADHPVLKGLGPSLGKEIKTRDISYKNKIYQQLISPTTAHGQDAWIIYCHDITALKNFEHELRQASQDAETAKIAAEQANKARGDFLAHISHELRTPMNGIMSLSDCLSEEISSPAHREWAKTIYGSAQNLLSLLNDLLDFSKIEAGKLTLEFVDFNLNRIIEQTLSIHIIPAQQKGITLEYEIDDDVPAFLKGDPVRIGQILNNLLSNAVKFTQKGGIFLQICGEPVTDNPDIDDTYMLRITVCDTGIGMSAERLDKIFKAYEQAETSITRHYGGTGLGLSITQDLVHLMKGHVNVKSIPGEGTEFSISIPLVTGKSDLSSVQDMQESTALRSSSVQSQARLLIIDDHIVNILGLGQMLRRRGYTHIGEALNGEQALTMIREAPYDLILLDCHMPDMDGFAFMDNLRDLYNASGLKLPVIIAVTADIRREMTDKCKAAGMDDFLGKPIQKVELYDMLDKWIPPQASDIAGGGGDIISLHHNGFTDPKSFNRERLAEFSGGDKEIEAHLIRAFLNTLDTDLSNMDKHARNKNHDEWVAAVHKLYGACSNIGAESIANLCDEAQYYTERVTDPDKIDILQTKIMKEGTYLQTLLKQETQDQQIRA